MRSPIITYNSKIKDVYHVSLDRYHDDRGCNIEGYSRDSFESKGFPKLSFDTDSMSRSRHGVIRGFHGDLVSHKIVSCLFGEIQLVAIDRRPTSPTFNSVVEFELSDRNPVQILLPPGVVNAHACLSAECIFFYKLSAGYCHPDQQIHVKYNDPHYNIEWKVTKPILSERDK